MLPPLAVLLQTQLGTCTGGSFVDSTALAVCYNPRIAQHQAFRVDARRGETSVGCFYGFKLRLVVNYCGELLTFCLTPGNIDDRRPIPRLIRHLCGELFGDRGYISQALAEHLITTNGLLLITKLRKNMRERGLAFTDQLLLSNESVYEQLKNICQLEHSRHRSPHNFLAHLLAGLIAYCHQPKKPSLHLARDLNLLAEG